MNKQKTVLNSKEDFLVPNINISYYLQSQKNWELISSLENSKSLKEVKIKMTLLSVPDRTIFKLKNRYYCVINNKILDMGSSLTDLN